MEYIAEILVLRALLLAKRRLEMSDYGQALLNGLM